MSGLLLDTNALVWTLTADPRLGPGARARITNGLEIVRHSAVSVLEITIKTMLGKLTLPSGLQPALALSGTTELPLTSAHAARLAAFPELARHDPFDRMLLAQARGRCWT